jgi:hypothetical protein
MNREYIPGLLTMSVSTVVGCTEFTRIRCGASSTASVRISPATPCLAAV